MRRSAPAALALLGLVILGPAPAPAREAKLVRYPHYRDGKITFTYLGDIWTADETGKNLQRLTAHRGRDAYSRFSPDGKWLAFTSDREGNPDVFLIPAEGGKARQLTTHSATDTVVGWTPDSSGVLFASNRDGDFMGKLYVAPLDGSIPRDAGPDMGIAGSYSPDGSKLALNRKGQSYWRQGYRGSFQTDVTVMDVAAKTFKDLTDFEGIDSWPMWSQDGHIYFVSDRDGAGKDNVWRVAESGGDAEKVTEFKGGTIFFPAMSPDGKTIVFEREHHIWKLDLASRKAEPIPLEIAAETQESLVEFRDFASQVDDYALAPNGRRIVLSIHGEVFTAPTGEDGGDLVQLTDSPWRDRNVEYSPDGKLVAFASDRSGREEIWTIASDGSGEPKKVTDLDALKASYAWSPDSKAIAFTTTDNKLYRVGADGQDQKELASSKYGGLGGVAWSPDGSLLAFSMPDVSRSTDIYLMPAAGGEAKKVTFDSASEMGPKFSSDAKKLYFVRTDLGAEGMLLGGERPSAQVFVVPLEKQDRDPEEADARGEPENAPEGMMRRAMAQRAATSSPPKAPKIDWGGLKRRTRQVTRMPSPVFTYTPGTDGKTVVFASSDSSGPVSMPSLYTIQDDGKRLTRIATGGVTTGEESSGPPRGRGRGFGFGGGFGNLSVTRDGRTVFYQQGDGVYSASLSGGGGAGGLAALLGAASGGTGGPGGGRPGGGGGPEPGSGALGGGGRRRVSFNVQVKIDRPAEWLEMFDDAWRTMKYRFYDPKMHGSDWDALRDKYRPLVEFVGDRAEILNLINEMIGELNASHTGAAPGGGRRGGGGGDAPSGVATAYLGIDLEPDKDSGRYRVAHVYEEGPADKDWVKVSKGDYVLAINGKDLKAGDDYWDRLNRRLNRKVQLTLNGKPSTEGSWKVKIDPISQMAHSQLRYEKWVKDRRAQADKLSGGRVGYLHIKAMDPPSLARFRKELAEYRHKEALVIDERFNGGGNIEQELLAILVQKPYQIWRPRGSEPTERPFAGYFGPKVVLQNWRSASNAEMFPAGFRALGLGKVIGTPTMGAVIGTGSYSLIDGSTVRTPGVGVFLADTERTNMENHAVKPDITVENSPEDNLAGRDRQLEVGVRELLKQLPAKGEVAGKGD